MVYPRNNVHQTSTRGFTLIEILVAMTILALTAVSFANLLVGTMKANLQAKRLSEAGSLAQDKFEKVRNAGLTQCTSDGSNGSASGTSGSYSWSCTIAAGPTTGVKDVTISAWYTNDSTVKSTLKTRILSS